MSYTVISKVADVENSKWLLSWSRRHISTTHLNKALHPVIIATWAPLEPLWKSNDIASWQNLSWDLNWSLECQQHVWLILSYTTKYDIGRFQNTLYLFVLQCLKYLLKPTDPEDVSHHLTRQDTHSWLEQWGGLFILYPAPRRGSSLSGGTPGYGAAPENQGE